MLVADHECDRFSLSTPFSPAKEWPGLRLNLTIARHGTMQSLRIGARDFDNVTWLRVVLVNAASRKLDHRVRTKTS